MSDDKRPILIVDGMNAFIRSYAAYPSMSSHGYQMGGCIGFLKTLRKLVNEICPSTVYVVWEGGGSQRRRNLYSEYKMNRRPEKLNRFYEDDIPDSDDNKKHQLIALLGMLKRAPVCQLYVSDCEGDDVIAYLSRQKFLNIPKIIASSDKDMYQLLDENTSIYSLHKKTYVNVESVINDYKVQPKNFALAKALCGDPSDNIPGVKGLGFKTVSKVLPFLGNESEILLEDVFNYCHAHLGESNHHKRIIENKEDVKRNWRLVYLDGSMLSQQQISKVDYMLSTFVPKVDRMGLVKDLVREGIGDFDVESFFLFICRNRKLEEQRFMSENNRVITKASFGTYGKNFQEKIVQALLVDKHFAEQTLEVFDVTYLEPKYLQFLSDRYFAYAKKYKVFPTLQLLITIIRDELKVGTDVLLRDQIVDYLQRMRTDPDLGDLQYVKEKSLDFCRKQALKKALEEAVDQIQAEKYESIVEGIKKAVMVGTAPQLGHDFFSDYESRFTRLQRNCVPTGLAELDKKEIFNGGLGAGEIGVVVAPTGVGKSHLLTYFGANALRHGIDVLHYTFELSEAAVGLRYDSNLCDIDSNQVIDNKDKILEQYKGMKLGRLIIKEFPTNTASIYTLRSHIERLEVKGFRPGVIIIDYADIMRSTRQFDSLRHELKLIYEELRGFASEKAIPIWTASQSNKEGSNSDIVDLSNMSEAYGKAMVADVVISLSRRSHEKSSGVGRLYVAKNRAGRDGLVYPVKIDTARSKFEILGDAGSFEGTVKESEDEVKRALRVKWKELKNDPVIGERLKKSAEKSSDDVTDTSAMT